MMQTAGRFMGRFVLIGRFFSRLFSYLSLFSCGLLSLTFCTQLAEAAQLTLRWSDSAHDQDGFYIERAAGTTGTFTRIDDTAATVMTYVDTGLTGGATYCYRVQAYNSAGVSGYTNTACGTAPTDTQAPTVSVTAPKDGATVSGSSVTVSASASDNAGVVGVQFRLDGISLNTEDIKSPYSMTWDTTTVSNGGHRLTAVARDAAGNTTTSTAISVTVSNTTSPNPTGLVAAYSFSEGRGTTTADSSGNDNTGFLSGQTWYANANDGAGLLFNANGAVDLGNDSSLQLTGSMTIEAWIEPMAFPVDDSSIVSKRGPDSSDNGFQLDTTIDTGLRTIGFKLADPNNNNMMRYGKTPLTTGVWQHVAGVYDATARTLHVYLNGVLDDGVLRGTVTSAQRNSGQHVLIGERPAGSSETEFAGKMDDVRIYDRALSATEILVDMATSVPSPGN